LKKDKGVIRLFKIITKENDNDNKKYHKVDEYFISTIKHKKWIKFKYIIYLFSAIANIKKEAIITITKVNDEKSEHTFKKTNIKEDGL